MSDVINRQDAINALGDDAELLRRVLDDVNVVGAERAKYEWGLELIESCISDMKELSSAEQKGKWISKEFRSDGAWKGEPWAFIHRTCSNCGWNHYEPINGKTYNYCPNCGARMVKENDRR